MHFYIIKNGKLWVFLTSFLFFYIYIIAKEQTSVRIATAKLAVVSKSRALLPKAANNNLQSA